jgi:MFS family permease
MRAILVGLVLVGIAVAGGGAALVTLLMELPGMTPSKMSTAFAIIWALAYAGAFLSPIAGGMLVSSLGLRNVLLAGLVFQLLPITSIYMLPETGLGRRPVVNGSGQCHTSSFSPSNASSGGKRDNRFLPDSYGYGWPPFLVCCCLTCAGARQQ